MNRIKEIRIRANLTLRELSKLVHIDYSYLSKIEKGIKNLTDETALKLAVFFSTDKNFILGNNNYVITCYTNDLKLSFSLYDTDIKKYGICYTTKIDKNNSIVNIIDGKIEQALLKEKLEAIQMLKKIINEKEIIDSMDEWSEINLQYAKTKIDSLLKKKR